MGKGFQVIDLKIDTLESGVRVPTCPPLLLKATLGSVSVSI